MLPGAHFDPASAANSSQARRAMPSATALTGNSVSVANARRYNGPFSSTGSVNTEKLISSGTKTSRTTIS
ncbi:MAG: hypothetical protein IPM40_21350 [Gammaproteobacteria bacterium]|nr:hypothetical protein [Gammaproteobacteria bacterium]